MGLLNRPSDGQLSVLLAFRRALLLRGPLPRQELLDLCAPRTLWASAQPGDDEKKDEANKKEQYQARITLTRWLEIGFFIQEENEEQTISLAPAFKQPGLDSKDPAPLRTALRRLVFSPANNPQILAEERDSEVAGRCADLTRGACWVLAQNSYAFPGGKWSDVDELIKEQVSTRPMPIQNDTRWYAYRDDYAPFLGLGWQSPLPGVGARLISDPTEAVLDELPGTFEGTRELPIGRFLERLAERLPVIDGGTYRQQIEEHLRKKDVWMPHASHEVSTSLSRALIRLEESGVIQLPTRSDAPEEKVLLGRDNAPFQRVSHVVWTRAA
ncbi:protein DpdG [Archangium sp.]|jgi:hypothetical protein|uniref:protein DpdG n=1 Tax=Archangium sp. TaxID=1872627 RepID=UPI002EDB0217